MEKSIYRWLYLNQLETYYKWDSPDIPILHLLETELRERGQIGYDLIHKCWVSAHETKTLDKNNEYEKYNCWTFNTTEKESYELTNHTEVVILRNNYLAQSDTPIIDFFASMAEDTDISIYYQLVNSRNIPMLQVETDAQKRAIESALKQVAAGKPAVITAKTLEGIKPVDILDPNAISKMEYLSNFNEILEKRRINIFGASLDSKDKAAQVTSTELKAYDDITTISFLSNYECRQDFCKEMAENGITISCTRNPIFADEPSDRDISNGTFEEKEDNKNEEDIDNQGDIRKPAENSDDISAE